MPVAEIKYEDLVFDPAVQQMCVTPKFTCPHYGHSWACPPEAPYLKEELAKYKKFYIVYFGVNLDDYVSTQRKDHPGWSENSIRNSVYFGKMLQEGYETELTTFLVTYNAPYSEKWVFWCGGSCALCENPKDGGCTHDAGHQCRHPDEMRYSMEAVGIMVNETVKKTGIEIEWPPVHWTYRIGLVCFK
ncbi:MAG: hypothetical protein RBG13Loki_3848 [Promethearchaeota archaeon CR_4]|nr:MAG: hypothetical protein RBG13Loki_3848 [Candidatus Lokiarchaeota archaeon CR_4]